MTGRREFANRIVRVRIRLMPPKSKPALHLFFLTALACFAASCGAPPAPTAAGPPAHAGVTLRVACPGAAAAVVERFGGGWAARQQARVEVTTYDPQAGPEPAAADV